MTDRNTSDGGREDDGREGFGDDQGARVGRPDAGTQGGSTGAGAEAAEGIHSAGGRDESERSGTAHGTGREAKSGMDRTGSEPLEGRTGEHQSGYGGEGGKPRTSSDVREGPDDASTRDAGARRHQPGEEGGDKPQPSEGVNYADVDGTVGDTRRPRDQMEQDI